MKRRHSNSPKKKHNTKRIVSLPTFVIVIPSIIILVTLFGFFVKTSIKPRVLGASTVLFADHGSDDLGGGTTSSADTSGSGGSSSTQSTSGETSGSGSSGGSQSSVSNNSVVNNTQSTTTQQTVSRNSLVDCIGPDGKHFTTSFRDCQELNQKWGHQNFNFTPLTTKQTDINQPEIRIEPSEKPEPTETAENHTGKFETETEGNKEEFNIATSDARIEIKRENSGEVKITAKKPDGTEIELKSEDALQKINDTLEHEGVNISTSAANGFAIRKGEVEAQTHFPLSVDPLTHILTVNTPAGTKEVAVLPDQAVQNVLQTRILSTVENQATASGSTQQIILTQLDNQPVFQINGLTNKRIFGIFPVSFAKTAFVSAQTGQIVTVEEAALNKILEALSI